MVTGKLYEGVDVLEAFMSKPDYTPKELAKRFAQFFKYADAEDIVNRYNQLPPEKQLAEAKKSKDDKLVNATLDTLFLEK